MRLLYNIGISIYGLGVGTAAVCGHEKAGQMCAGWKHQMEKIPTERLGKGKTAWFHASSLGEFEQARPILERFKKEHPDYTICLTFFSPSGYEVRKNYAEADYICYLPLDTPGNARRFVDKINPCVAFFVKYDHWFNYLNELHKREVPTFLFSAIFRPGQYFFKWYGGWFAKQLGIYRHIFVQNEQSQRLLASKGIENVTLGGDTRFDRVNDIARGVKQFEIVEQFVNSQADAKVLLAGSSWEEDERHLKAFEDRYEGPLKLVIAPHMIHKEHIEYIETLFGKERCARYSQLKDGAERLAERPVLIIDNIGILSSLYQYADVAYIGGGFGKGIHNILEALTYGKPVVFGPNYQKFQEAKDIIARGGGQSYSTQEELNTLLDKWLKEEDTHKKASHESRKYVEANLGATDKIFEMIDKTVK